jgi:phosphoribosylaminoimidazolecarboxamide formyltransferase/IMP cyclohydrolase
MKLAGMASNNGRNLRNIAERAPGGAEFAVVLSNDTDAPVLDAMADRGIPTEVVERDPGESRESHEERVLDALSDYEFDLVCLDGYMRILTGTFLDAAPTTINVHPSLLPAFPGMDAHGQVLGAGAKVTGCTVHVATEEVDAGPIVTQEAVPVHDDDTEADLKERVLYDAEFAAYPRAVKWFAEDRVAVDHEAGTVNVEGDDAGRRDGEGDDGVAFPARRIASTDRERELRYGENPHQAGALYADPTCEEANVVDAPQRNAGAKGMSYNNYNDADAALNLVTEFEDPAAAVIKHTNPAGAAVADTVSEAYADALATDPKSAFGGIVALNRECDRETAGRIVDSFKEVVVAPGYTEAALSTLAEKENLRALDVGALEAGGVRGAFEGGDPAERLAEKPIVGGRLVQERDRQRLAPEDLEVVTEREPTDEQIKAMLFAWRTIKHVKSNAIVYASGTETVGIGMGQVSRVDAVRLAGMKAEKDAKGKTAAGAVMASDAFFPFPDGVEVAAEHGIEAVIQPGGSIRDEEVTEAADDLGLAMVHTGQRAFRHD